MFGDSRECVICTRRRTANLLIPGVEGVRPARPTDTHGVSNDATQPFPSGGNFQRGQFLFSLPPQEQVLLQGADGRASISTIIGKLDQTATLTERRELARAFYRRIWRLGHLFYRTA